MVDDLFFVIDGIGLRLALDEIKNLVPPRIVRIDDNQFLRVGLALVLFTPRFLVSCR